MKIKQLLKDNEKLRETNEKLLKLIESQEEKMIEYEKYEKCLKEDNCLRSKFHASIPANLVFDHFKKPIGIVYKHDSYKEYREFHQASLKECDEIISVSLTTPKEWFDVGETNSQELKDFLDFQISYRVGEGSKPKTKMTRYVLAKFPNNSFDKFMEEEQPKYEDFIQAHLEGKINLIFINLEELSIHQKVDFALFIKNDNFIQKWVITCPNFRVFVERRGQTSIEYSDFKIGIEYYEELINKYKTGAIGRCKVVKVDENFNVSRVFEIEYCYSH